MSMCMGCRSLVVRLLLYAARKQKSWRNEHEKKANEQVDELRLCFVEDDLRREIFARDRVRFIYVNHGVRSEQ